ncbi:MAG: serine/threonine protein kinase [Gammaproteobacteria bacterium]|nr:serine/threonine protein kinase [Gammaproteobacteria bacterium]MBT8106166.1 serine/threonine protein kinase [Gammaproteobacteria bacterium]NNF50167.1 serine/threonine protein kinase [Woeseiaceae bacterium]NNK26180.1 serine/threonine protein kinase [Woeseiaceae bacterium]NNL62910.1 serine/threonine protein kinase [Woeseiaceae bacterium]
MSIKVMIIDEQADFRSLLMHHVTTNWPDAIISAYDPTSAGHLPDEFSGADNDLILLGSRHGEDREGVDVLRRFMRRDKFPPVVYFGTEDDQQEAHALRPDAHFIREHINHDSLVKSLGDVLVARRRVASTSSLLGGDMQTGVQPLIKGYRLIRRLSSTSHSGVYLAERESTHFQVVLKVLRQVPGHEDTVGAFDRFLQEYETIADIEHPHVVRIFDLGVSDDHAHIAMEYLDGGDLRGKIEKGIAERQAVQYLRQIASGLSAVHEKRVMHRDLKPGNIMLRKDGSIALIDFGLAKKAKLESEITDTGEIFGTPYYMSPEQGHGSNVDARSDIYSLGVIFYEMLTGEKPFQADTAMGIIYQHANAPVPLLPERLAAHQALLNTMLAKEPEQRPQTATEIEAWL